MPSRCGVERALPELSIAEAPVSVQTGDVASRPVVPKVWGRASPTAKPAPPSPETCYEVARDQGVTGHVNGATSGFVCYRLVDKS